jgi:hypothetical protein
MPLAVLATIDKPATQRAADQGQSVTGSLTGNPQIGTGPPPFAPVRQNVPSGEAKMCQQVCQLVAQRPIDFGAAEFLQSWVQQNERMPEIGAAYGGAHATIPFHAQTRRQTLGLEQA